MIASKITLSDGYKRQGSLAVRLLKWVSKNPTSCTGVSLKTVASRSAEVGGGIVFQTASPRKDGEGRANHENAWNCF